MISLLGRHYNEFEKNLLRKHNLEKVIALNQSLLPEKASFDVDVVDSAVKANTAFDEVKGIVDVLINAYDAQLPSPRIMLGTGYVEPYKEDDSALELLSKKAKRLGGSAVDTLRKDVVSLGIAAVNSALMQKSVLKRIDPRITGLMVGFQYYKSTKHNERIHGEQLSTLLYLKQNPLPLFRLQSALLYSTFVQDAFAKRLTFVGQNNPFNRALDGVQAGIGNTLAYALEFDEVYKNTTEHFLKAHVQKVEDFLRFTHKELTPELEEKVGKMDTFWSTYKNRKLMSPRADSMMTTIALLSGIKHGDAMYKDLVRGKYDALRDI